MKCSTLLNPDATLQMKKAKCAQCVNFCTEEQTGGLQLHMLPNRYAEERVCHSDLIVSQRLCGESTHEGEAV